MKIQIFVNMDENTNLCEILKGLEGIELYSVNHGKVKLIKIDLDYDRYPIRCVEKITGDLAIFTKDGKYIDSYDGECTLFPSKDQRDWSKFERPILKDTPMMCCKENPKLIVNWVCRFYAGISHGHIVKPNGTLPTEYYAEYYQYMIPFDKFNPNNIEGSLKYNIQK